MKRLATLFLMAALLLCAAAALAEQPSSETAARSVVPENAELLRTEKEDGLLEYLFRTPDGAQYEVDVNPETSAVVKAEMEAADRRGGASVVLTQEQALQTVLERFPEAVIHYASTDREDGGHVYQIRFSTGQLTGKAELNAETGALTELELHYTDVPLANGPLTADEARALVLSMVDDGRITEFETDRDDGRTQYEGEVTAGGVEYDFTIDAETGAVVEWETDSRR